MENEGFNVNEWEKWSDKWNFGHNKGNPVKVGKGETGKEVKF